VINAVIIEDEVLSLNNLRNLLQQNCNGVQIVGTASSVAEGVELFQNPNIDIDVAFLDISLPDGLVFKLLNQIRPITFEIIFVTAYEKHAITACNYASVGYILKPIDPDALQLAIARIERRRADAMEKRLELFTSHYNNPNVFNKMSISAVDGIHFVNIKDIIRFEAEDNYTHIYLLGGERITASKTIKSYENMLDTYNFYRVHKRHVVNLNFIRKFTRGEGSMVIMEDGLEIDVSRRRRPAFLERLRLLQAGPIPQ
jgi:two-component system LytT family response regulator